MLLLWDMISLCGATRGRPEAFRKAIESALNTAAFPGKLEILIKVDDDDNSSYAGIPRNVQFVSGPRLGVGTAKPTNLMAARASGSIIMHFSDDQEYITEGWDSLILKEDDSLPVAFKVNEERTQLEHPIVNRAWLDRVGYLYPKEFNHLYCDTFIEAVATKAGILVELPHVRIKHKKFMAGQDEVFKEARLGASEDFAAFVAMKDEIERLANALKG